MDDSFMASEQQDYINDHGLVVASENGEVISEAGGASFPNVSRLHSQNEYDQADMYSEHSNFKS